MDDKLWIAQKLLTISEATAGFRAQRYFAALALCLTRHLGVRFAFVTVPLAEKPEHGRTLVFADAQDLKNPFQYDLSQMPCRAVLNGTSVNVPCNIAELYPSVGGVESYCGAPLTGSGGEIIGLIAVEDTKPLPRPEALENLLRILGGRTAAELECVLHQESLLPAGGER